MNYICYLSGEHLALAQAECKALSTLVLQRERLLITKTIPQNPAFTKEIHELFFHGTPIAVQTWAEKHPHPTTKSIKIEKKGSISMMEAKKILIPWLSKPPVNLARPEETYALIADEEAWYLTKKIWENTENFAARKSHNKPAPHPTGLHPKLARSMINLAQADQILDPFCGAGGILLEGALMGKHMIGNDLDPHMIRRCTQNLQFFEVNATLHTGDALHWTTKTPAIVTDLPYGKNSKAAALEPLYTAFLTHAKKITNTMVVGFPDCMDNKTLITAAGWTIKEQFTWILHRSLRKEIYVLNY